MKLKALNFNDPTVMVEMSISEFVFFACLYWKQSIKDWMALEEDFAEMAEALENPGDSYAHQIAADYAKLMKEDRNLKAKVRNEMFSIVGLACEAEGGM